MEKLTVPGLHGDGGNLYLQVGPTGSRSWIFRYHRAGVEHNMGLGPLGTVTLAEARELAREQRKLLLRRVDPLEVKRDALRASQVQRAAQATFEEDALAYIAAHEAGWKSIKHRLQWESTLRAFAFPHIGHMLVSDIDTPHVLKCLQPIWTEKTETASRVRSRIEAVLDYSTASKHRHGDNPARWKGCLDALLASPKKVAKVEHHAALAIDDLPAFMAELRQRDSISARALEFTILCASRTGEVIGADWSEIDLETGLWSLPPERMKANRPHVVPLSTRVREILEALPHRKGYLFPGAKEGNPLSNMALAELLKGMRPGVTVHGFRSVFRDWCSERTNTAREVAEMSLAHTIGDAVERAYRRGDLLAKRKKLMQQWASFCAFPAERVAKVTPIHSRR